MDVVEAELGRRQPAHHGRRLVTRDVTAPAGEDERTRGGRHRSAAAPTSRPTLTAPEAVLLNLMPHLHRSRLHPWCGASPDLQYTDADGRRVYVEYDRPLCSDPTRSSRGAGHEQRSKANDPTAIVILKVLGERCE